MPPPLCAFLANKTQQPKDGMFSRGPDALPSAQHENEFNPEPLLQQIVEIPKSTGIDGSVRVLYTEQGTTQQCLDKAREMKPTRDIQSSGLGENTLPSENYIPGNVVIEGIQKQLESGSQSILSANETCVLLNEDTDECIEDAKDDHSDVQLQGSERSFDTETEIIGSIRHRNIVRVIGCCSSPEFKALVLTYVPNGSLDKWLYSNIHCLDLIRRLKIAIDVAAALEYLHHGHTFPVVRRDVKPSNVLLDQDMVVHLGDFGIGKLFDDGEVVVQTQTLATIGYAAPELGMEGKVSTQGDEERRSPIWFAFDPGGEASPKLLLSTVVILRGSHLEDKVDFNRGGVDTSSLLVLIS